MSNEIAPSPALTYRLISIKEVCDTIGLSRSHVYALEAKGDFPRRVKLGKSARWVESEIQQYIRTRMLARDVPRKGQRRRA